MKNKEPIMSSAFGLALFYAIVLSVADYTLLTTSVQRLPMLIFVFFGVMAGCTVGGLIIKGNQAARRDTVQPTEYMGIRASLGMIPLHAFEPETCEPSFDPKRVRDFPHIQSADKPELRDFMTRYFEKYRESHPGHVKLMQKLLDILEYQKDLPATHIEGGHGNQTLQQHSLLVSHVMAMQKERFTYKGAKKGKQVMIPLKDEKYVFDKDDPLIEILGIAHDIGKIESYEYDKKDKARKTPIDMRKDHDIVGARILARMPEIWDLPDVDRNYLLTIVAHYHHPSEIPMETATKPISDRLQALLELLIFCDIATGAIEMGAARSADHAFKEAATSDAYIEDYRAEADAIWEAVLAVINQPKRINSKDPYTNIGVRIFSEQYRKELLYIREDHFMEALAIEMGITVLADSAIYRRHKGVHNFTKRVMKVLDEQGVIFKEHDDVERNAPSRLYRVRLLEKQYYYEDQTESMPRSKEAILNSPKVHEWASTVILECEPNFRGTLTLPDVDLRALIRNSRFGAMGVKKVRPPGSNEPEDLDDELAADGLADDADAADGDGLDDREGPQPNKSPVESMEDKTLEEIQAETLANREVLTVMRDGSMSAGDSIGPVGKNVPLTGDFAKQFDLGAEQRKAKMADKKAEDNRLKLLNQPPSMKLKELSQRLFFWTNSGRFKVDNTLYGLDVVVYLEDPIRVLTSAGNPNPANTWKNIRSLRLTKAGLDVHTDDKTGEQFLIIARPGKEHLCPHWIEPTPAEKAAVAEYAAQNPDSQNDGDAPDGQVSVTGQDHNTDEPSGESTAAPETTSAVVDMDFFSDGPAAGFTTVEETAGQTTQTVSAPSASTGVEDWLSEQPQTPPEHQPVTDSSEDLDAGEAAYPLPSKATGSAIGFDSLEDQQIAESTGPVTSSLGFLDEPVPAPSEHLGPLGRRLRMALERHAKEGTIVMVPAGEFMVCKPVGIQPLLDIEWPNPELTFDKITQGKLADDGVVIYTTKSEKTHIAIKPG